MLLLMTCDCLYSDYLLQYASLLCYSEHHGQNGAKSTNCYLPHSHTQLNIFQISIDAAVNLHLLRCVTLRNSIIVQQEMQQVQDKNEQFHKQIRQRHHDQLFKKMRHAYSNSHYNSNSNSTAHRSALHQMFDALPSMYELAHNIEAIVDNEQRILEYVEQIRKYEDNEAVVCESWEQYDSAGLRGRDRDAHENGAYVPLMQYLLHVSTIINKHINNIDIEGNNYEDDQEHEKAYGTLLLPISFFLINFSSIDSATQYIRILTEFAQFRTYIDLFHNLFLMVLPIQAKELLMDCYLNHLSNSPRFCLNNCHILSKTLYYAIMQEPRLRNNNSKHCEIMINVLRAIEKLNSIIGLIDGPDNQDMKQNVRQYKQYSAQILEQLTLKNESMCLEVARSTFTMACIDKTISQFKMYCSVSGKMVDDECKFEEISATLCLVSNMAYWDDVQAWVAECKPTILMSLVAVYQKLPLEQWIVQPSHSKKAEPLLPPMLANQKFKPIMLPRLLKCLTNIISLDEQCEQFTSKMYLLNKHSSGVSWVDILAIIYNENYKCMEVRVQCLMLFSNALLGSVKNYLKCGEQQQNIMSTKSQDRSNLTMVEMLDCCLDIVMEVLKLSNNHKKIIVSVLKTLLSLLQQADHLGRKSQIFSDHSLRNRLAAISESNFGIHQHVRNDYYDEDVRLLAHHMLEALSIHHE